MGDYTDKVSNKAIETSMSAADTLVVVISGLVKRITMSSFATSIASLITGAQTFAVRAVTASSYSAVAADRIINADTTSNAVNINVDPLILWDSTNSATAPLWVNKVAGGSNVTITPTSGTIDAGSSKVISTGGKLVYSDGSNLYTL